MTDRTGDWLQNWADKAGDRVFIAERSGAGWREESYIATLQKVRAIAALLLARAMGPENPILIMSGNGVDHGLLTLAAQYVGVPTVPLAKQYSLITGAHGRLQHAIELVRPKMAMSLMTPIRRRYCPSCLERFGNRCNQNRVGG